MAEAVKINNKWLREKAKKERRKETLLESLSQLF
jgi:hypothetical protein